MHTLMPIEPIDYLMIGHITRDITPSGLKLGGTASYASLTARALGLRVGIVTSFKTGEEIPELTGIPITSRDSEYSSTFENIYTPKGRVQFIFHQAEPLDITLIPQTWRAAPIVHMGPVCQEVDPNLARAFPNAVVGVTPQGWLRNWDASGKIQFSQWPEARYVLESSTAAVMSIEDINYDESIVEDWISSIRILVITEGAEGARLYWNGDLRRFRPPVEQEVDPVGAGDIFAASFFIRLQQTRDPWEAARFATLLAANSVTRPGLEGIPTVDEVNNSIIQVLP
jgi:sugar/nucleoside kinase (ribokinase family)